MVVSVASEGVCVLAGLGATCCVSARDCLRHVGMMLGLLSEVLQRLSGSALTLYMGRQGFA